MLHILKDSSAKVLIVESALLEIGTLSAEDLHSVGCILIVIGGNYGNDRATAYDYETLLRQGLIPELPTLDEADYAAISYTSGTTGLPKGALFTQQGVRDAMIWTVVNAGLRHEDVWYAAAPAPGAPLMFGAMNIVNGMTTVLPGNGFDVNLFPSIAQKWSITSGIFVPTMLISLIAVLEKTGERIDTFRQLCYGSSPATQTLIRAVSRVFGCDLQQWYSATELTAAPAAILRQSQHQLAINGDSDGEILRSSGVPQPQVQLAIRDSEGRDVEVGQPGEVWIRTATAFVGYLNHPEQTAEALSTDGWVRPGDLGKVDSEGRLYLLDRKNFLIISGGYNVYPNVVEDVVAELPAVGDVAVIGAAHPHWGECVVAVVVVREGRELTAEQVIDYCKSGLGKWEVPKFVDFVDEIPRNAAAKADRRAVRDWYRNGVRALPWSMPAS